MLVHTSPAQAHAQGEPGSAPFATQLTAGWGFAGELEVAGREAAAAGSLSSHVAGTRHGPRAPAPAPGNAPLLLEPERRAALALWKGMLARG